MKNKIRFVAEPRKHTYGEWRTEDGFKCFTDNRTSAVRWYKKWLDDKNKLK